jgi:hypothetical protein
MSDHPADRRKLLALRALIDEMMNEIRDVSTRNTWTPEERAQAERDLQRIMGQVVTASFEGSPQLETAS